MANVPLPTGYKGVDDLPKRRELLINLMPTQEGIVRTPGISSVITSAGTGCRGARTWSVDEKAYFVKGTTLYRLESNETETNLGTIAGTEDVVFSDGQIFLVIMVIGGSAYSYDATNGLQSITDPAYVASQSVTFINGRHFFVPSDGSPGKYTKIENANTGVIEMDGFIDAEQLPDLNRHCINLKNTLVVFGTSSAQNFRNSGDESLPFIPMTGTRIEAGFVAGGSNYKNTYVFIGRAKDQDYAIYAIAGQGREEKISNAAVTEDLNDLTQAEVEAAIVNRFTWLGQEIVAWTVATRTFAFIGGEWIILDSVLNGDEYGPWRAKGVAFAYGRFYIGDRSSNNIGKLADIASEYGTDVEAQLDTFYRGPRNSYFSPSSLEVDVLTGQNGSTIGLSLSKDGRLKSDYFYESLGVTGDYDKRVKWEPPGGLGEYENYMGISLRFTGQVQFSAEALDVS